MRPNPEQILKTIQQENHTNTAGKLKIFFGACAGVGKTYAMLQSAHDKKKQGLNVVIGIVETHGRKEIIKLLNNLQEMNLPILPSNNLEYHGKIFAEFNLQAALELKPDLIIIDELAHSNIAGSRHAKRWQDVEELLNAGIDVYSTLNVQHLETLNDIVNNIFGIKVWETIPDRIFDNAYEIILIDLPADELIYRLTTGKIYTAENIIDASKKFFRKGNIIALRELALRRTADRVDSQMQDYRSQEKIVNIWEAKERLIACIGIHTNHEKLIRETARLAAKLQTEWIAVYIDESSHHTHQNLHKYQKALETLQLAEKLGGKSTVIHAQYKQSIAQILIEYAQNINANKLLIGYKTQYSNWIDKIQHKIKIKNSIYAQLMSKNLNFDIILIGLENYKKNGNYSNKNKNLVNTQSIQDKNKKTYLEYMYASIACGITTFIASLLFKVFDASNIIMLFLLTVMLVSMRYGGNVGAFASMLCVACFDFFFIEPRLSFSVNDFQYLFTFAVMLVVSLVISQLSAKLRFEAKTAKLQEKRAIALGLLAKELSAALQAKDIIQISIERLKKLFNIQTDFLLPNLNDELYVYNKQLQELKPIQSLTTTIINNSANLDIAIASWVYKNQQQAGYGTQTLNAVKARYLPLKAPMRTRGVVVIYIEENLNILEGLFDNIDETNLLNACISQIALALERVHYVEITQNVLVQMEGERLRNSLLASVSHDLKTPLTSIIGLASMLEKTLSSDQINQQDLSLQIRNEAMQMSQLITNLLDMAKLQSNGVTLRKDWHSIQEIIGSSLNHVKYSIKNHSIKTDIDINMPLVKIDALLIERVIVNLLDNAIQYTSENSIIQIHAKLIHDINKNHLLYISIEDNGKGLSFAKEKIAQLFEPFTRGNTEHNIHGVGLGLALCKLIITAHNGNIEATNNTQGGALFIIKLPVDILSNLE